MCRFAILLLSIVLVPLNAGAQGSVDLAEEVEQLLRIHESDRRAHFETSAERISGARATQPVLVHPVPLRAR